MDCDEIQNPEQRQTCQLKTLADFKRVLTPGREVILRTSFGQDVNHHRKVDKLQSNAVKFITDEGKPRWLDLPKAAQLEFDGRIAKIYDVGLRDLTDEEKRIIANEPRDPEQEKIDMLTDGSTMFHRQRKYYRSLGKEYLSGGSEPSQGMLLTHGAGPEPKIRDNKVKGELILVYEVL